MDKIDKYWIGILIGLIAPALFGWVYIDRFHLWGALRAFDFQAGTMVSKLLIVMAFPDMALLFLFYALNAWKTAKGVLLGILPYVIAAIFFASN
jgi:hypothetical protein